MEMESRQTLEVHLWMLPLPCRERWLENWLIDNPRQLSDFLVQNGHAAVYRGGSRSARQTTSIKWKTKKMHLSVKPSMSAAHQIMDQLIIFFPIPLSISSFECTVGAEVVWIMHIALDLHTETCLTSFTEWLAIVAREFSTSMQLCLHHPKLFHTTTNGKWNFISRRDFLTREIFISTDDGCNTMLSI